MDVMNADFRHLNATEAKAVERDEDGLTYLWLAEKTPQAIHYLTMARPSGSDRIYLERDDQAWSCHSGIEKVWLSPRGLKLCLNAEGKSHLGGMDHLDVAFAAEVQPSYGNIEKVLRLLLPDGMLSVQQE
jgi:hypothetical protein